MRIEESPDGAGSYKVADLSVGGGSVRRSPLSPLAWTDSEAVDEGDEIGLLATAQRGEVVAGGESLSVVGEDRVLERVGAAVVEEGGPDAGAPERGRAHLIAQGAILRDPVIQG